MNDSAARCALLPRPGFQRRHAVTPQLLAKSLVMYDASCAGERESTTPAVTRSGSALGFLPKARGASDAANDPRRFSERPHCNDLRTRADPLAAAGGLVAALLALFSRAPLLVLTRPPRGGLGQLATDLFIREPLG
jgi:hypothetical protein